MTIHGSCLCGVVQLEIEVAEGPFEICHCNRCRKVSGAQGMPAITVRCDQYRMTAGRKEVQSYSAPILYAAPAYQSHFCRICGSPVPNPDPVGDHLEIPAGIIDDDPGIKPDKHIFIEFVPAWDQLKDKLPQYSIADLMRERHSFELPASFTLKSHYDVDDT